MKLVTLLLVLFTTSAWARVPPGGPPWSCNVLMGCTEKGICDDVEGRPINFSMSQVKGVNRYSVEDFRDRKFQAETFSTLREAKKFLRTESSSKVHTMLFIHSNEIADAHGFRLHSVNTSESRKHSISKDYLLVACNSQR